MGEKAQQKGYHLRICSEETLAFNLAPGPSVQAQGLEKPRMLIISPTLTLLGDCVRLANSSLLHTETDDCVASTAQPHQKVLTLISNDITLIEKTQHTNRGVRTYQPSLA